MYSFGTRKFHPGTQIISPEIRQSLVSDKLFRSSSGISLSHNKTYMKDTLNTKVLGVVREELNKLYASILILIILFQAVYHVQINLNKLGLNQYKSTQ